MGFYDTDEGVEKYFEMADGYDGRELIAHLRTLLPAGALVLEVGIGPGKDLDLLAETFNVTGSDLSDVFLARYRQRKPTAELLKLDAVTLATDRRFDGIYSNKVLHHLPPEDLRRSLSRQAELLRPGGVLLHSFWAGEGEDEHGGLRFYYHTSASLEGCTPATLERISVVSYREMEDGDSLRAVFRKRA